MWQSLDIELTVQYNCTVTTKEHLADNPGRHRRTKHIDIRYHYVRETIDNRQVAFHHVGKVDQAADMLTKPLKSVKHDHNCNFMRLEVQAQRSLHPICPVLLWYLPCRSRSLSVSDSNAWFQCYTSIFFYLPANSFQRCQSSPHCFLH